ncbi:MAG: hypothetical protein R2941_00435 [Desulfobacterales bacterium]
MVCSFSNLSDSALKSIQKLEKEIGKTLLSFSCGDIRPAAVGDDVLAKIQKLEKELSVSLLAVEA